MNFFWPWKRRKAKSCPNTVDEILGPMRDFFQKAQEDLTPGSSASAFLIKKRRQGINISIKLLAILCLLSTTIGIFGGYYFSKFGQDVGVSVKPTILSEDYELPVAKSSPTVVDPVPHPESARATPEAPARRVVVPKKDIPPASSSSDSLLQRIHDLRERIKKGK